MVSLHCAQPSLGKDTTREKLKRDSIVLLRSTRRKLCSFYSQRNTERRKQGIYGNWLTENKKKKNKLRLMNYSLIKTL